MRGQGESEERMAFPEGEGGLGGLRPEGMRHLLLGVLKASGATAGGILLTLLVGKIIAVAAGTAGTGEYSLLAGTMQTAAVLAGLGGTSFVQGIASRQGPRREQFVARAGGILVGTTLAVTLFLVVASGPIAYLVLGRADGEAASLIRWLALPVLLSGLGMLGTGILNGYRAIGRQGLASLAGALATAILAYPLARAAAAEQPHAWVALLTAGAACTLTAAVGFAGREGWLSPLLRPLGLGTGKRGEAAPMGPMDGAGSPGLPPDRPVEGSPGDGPNGEAGATRERAPRSGAETGLREFMALSGVTVASSLLQVGALLAIRALLTRGGGLEAAGLFAAAWGVGVVPFMVLTTVFGAYYVPTLSGMHAPGERHALIARVLRLALVVVVPVLIVLIALKPLALNLLYDASFVPATETARWLLLGDYFKVVGWVFSVPMVAFAHSRPLFWSELVWNAGFLGLSAWALVAARWAEGVGAAFFAMYLVYFGITTAFVRMRHGFRFDRRTLLSFLCGLGLITAVSVQTWNQAAVVWPQALAWIAAGLGFSWFSLSGRERSELRRLARRLAAS